MSLADIIAAARAARSSDLDTWKAVIERGVAACANVKQRDVKVHGPTDIPANRWCDLSEGVIPDEYRVDGAFTLEAWVDCEGVLDIEVPRYLAQDLARFCEDADMRVAVVLGADPDRAQLAINLHRAPPPRPRLMTIACSPEAEIHANDARFRGAMLGYTGFSVIVPNGVTEVTLTREGYESLVVALPDSPPGSEIKLDQPLTLVAAPTPAQEA